jgi:hypothetical protein
MSLAARTDERGHAMWDRVLALLDRAQKATA